jgi:hypothetical protein
VRHAGENIITVLTHILNSIFLEGDIPEVLKIGLLSPIFKNKGSKNDAVVQALNNSPRFVLNS